MDLLNQPVCGNLENMWALFPCLANFRGVFDPGVFEGESRQDRIHYEFVSEMRETPFLIYKLLSSHII